MKPKPITYMLIVQCMRPEIGVMAEYTDEELRQAYRACVRHVEYSANNYREELYRRSQDRAASAMNRWTLVIAVATLVNVLVVLWQILRSIGHP